VNFHFIFEISRLMVFKVDLCLEPHSTTFYDLFFRNVRLKQIYWSHIT